LLQNTIQRSARNINAWLSRHRNGPRFIGIPELTMTTFGPRQIPAVFLKKSDDVPNFHLGNNKVFAGPEEAA